MGLNEILLIVAALVPAVILCIYVFSKDRVEKEPIGLLLGLLLAGCVIAYPASLVEGWLGDVINGFFCSIGVEADGEYYLSHNMYRIYQITDNFIGIALVEEGFKFLALFFITRKNKNFNSLFDGVIYAVFVSLGFAALENVLYALSFGWETVLLRAVLSVPGHMFYAVLMGCYYSLWHMYEKAKEEESNLRAAGIIHKVTEPFSGTKYLVLSLVIPVLVHGLYDYLCTAEGWLTVVSFYAFVVVLYIFCFGRIKKMSKADMPDELFSKILVLKKYPYLADTAESNKP